MTRFYSDILDSQLSKPLPNITLNLVKHIRTLHPKSQFVPTVVGSGDDFPLSEYLITVLQTHPTVDPTESHVAYNYDNSKAQRKTFPDVIAGVITFTFKQTEFRAYKATWSKGWDGFYFYGFVYDGPDDTLGQELATEVYRYANALKKEIWVYDSGYWAKSKSLFESIHTASWDDVVLKEEFKEGLRRDTETFFQSKEVYESLGITWKRGILLLGPPGNGKTESIKALLNEFGKTALYVKSFTTNRGPEYGVRSIFDHARKHSPCILILEDLDSMVTPKVKSFLLNELDGLAQNDGILTIATTNHPERIDDAILNRPSRFDVKYNFTLPEYELRKTFATRWIRKVEGLGATAANGQGVVFEKTADQVAEDVAQNTDGWSFAFLKELFVSFLLRVAHDNSLRVLESKSGKANNSNGQVSVETILADQIKVLSAQILKKKEKDERKKRKAQKAKEKAKVEGESDEEDSSDSSCEDEGDCCGSPVVETERAHVGVNF